MPTPSFRKSPQPTCREYLWSLLCAVLIVGACVTAKTDHALAGTATTASPVCIVSVADLERVLTRTRMHLTQGEALTIVAIGSSSTEGAGASSPAATYPSRLEALLNARFPANAIRVLNRGIGGEEEADMLARFERDVAAAKPDLVFWQVGSNAVMRDRGPSTERALIRKGIVRLKRTGADVVLIDPQYTAAIIAKPVAVATVELISTEARRHNIGAFHRFELMRDWRVSQHLAFEVFSIADGLHMNDWGYDCLARNLAAAIIQSVQPAMALLPVASPRSAPEGKL
jgi:acyl-CoA thioesterase-1